MEWTVINIGSQYPNRHSACGHQHPTRGAAMRCHGRRSDPSRFALGWRKAGTGDPWRLYRTPSGQPVHERLATT